MELDREIFDRVALSIRLLINTLSVVLEDTIQAVCPPASSVFAPWTTEVASYMRGYLPFQGLKLVPFEFLRAPLEEFAGARHFRSMPTEEATRHLHEYSRFCAWPPGAKQGGRVASRLHELFIENGWCPFRAFQLCRSQDYIVLNHLASLVRNVSEPEDHGRCLESERCCSHNLILDQPSRYPFVHADDHEFDCDFVHVPQEEVVEIIQSGGIPLISVSIEGDLDLQVITSSP